jgi:hypothetical protein
MFDFNITKKLVRDVADTVRQTRAKIEKLQQERDDTISAPLPKADVKDAMVACVQRKSEAYQNTLRTVLEPAIREPGLVLDAALFDHHATIAGPNFGASMQMLGTNVDKVLCGLFGTLLSDSLNKIIDNMEWPTPGLPVADRVRKVKALDADISKLIKLEADLVNEAHSAGLIIEG